jgi:hypothetical protein
VPPIALQRSRCPCLEPNYSPKQKKTRALNQGDRILHLNVGIGHGPYKTFGARVLATEQYAPKWLDVLGPMGISGYMWNNSPDVVAFPVVGLELVALNEQVRLRNPPQRQCKVDLTCTLEFNRFRLQSSSPRLPSTIDSIRNPRHRRITTRRLVDPQTRLILIVSSP